MEQAATLPNKINSHDTHVPIEDLRLVYKVRDEQGFRDVIVRHMHAGEPYIDRPQGSILPKHTRYVSGVNIELDWPEDDPPEESAQPCDTSRRDIETLSPQDEYHPSVQYGPFPDNVIDELQNKFAPGRGRHDYAWMGQKIIQDAEKTWRKNRKMLTPKQQYHEAKSKAKRTTPPPALTEETQKAIRDMQAMTLV